ncbi:MAG: PKD domain-containing protein [Bacteroidota bacterium]|nr:PKD domain-containing protein [Bacteroidota bacterium]
MDFGWESFICDSAVYFDDLSSGNGKPIDFWVWDYGDGSPMDTIFAPDDPDVSHVYAFGGEYNVTLLVQNTGGCADTLSQTVFREYCINANFAVIDTLLCQGFELSFSDSSIYADIITSWQWNFGDGADTAYVNHAPIITHTYPDAGTYQVSLVIFSSVGGVDISDTLTKNVTVLPTPIPAFSVPAVCLGDPSVFTDLSNPNGSQLQSWYWEFVAGSTDATSVATQPGLHLSRGRQLFGQAFGNKQERLL